MFLATRQHFSNACFLSIYLAVDTIFQSSVSYQDLLDRELIVSRKLLNQGDLRLLITPLVSLTYDF
jgi:hypothetical protein